MVSQQPASNKVELNYADRLLILQVISRTGDQRQAKVAEVQDRLRHLFRKCRTLRNNGYRAEADSTYERAATLKAALASTLLNLADADPEPLPTLEPLHHWQPDPTERLSAYADVGV